MLVKENNKIKARDLQFLAAPQEEALDWDDYVEKLDKKPPRGISLQSWYNESARMLEAVADLTQEESKFFQYLLDHEIYDYVGPTEARIMNVRWRVSESSYWVSEPEGDSIPDISISLANSIKDQKIRTREKKDGVFFRGDGQVMEGTFKVRAPYKKAEFVRGVFFVFDEIKTTVVHEGWEFRPHLFTDKKRASQEGMVIQFEGREYKWKFYPTVEVEIEAGQYNGLNVLGLSRGVNSGIFEVYFSGKRAVVVRERFHKKPQDYVIWSTKSSLHFYRSYFGFSDSLSLELSDSTSWAQIADDGSAYIYPLPQNLEEMKTQVEDKDYVPAHREVVSSKASFRYSDGSVAVIKEEHKVWDFVGGQLANGETPAQALEREMQEEIGVVLPYRYSEQSLGISGGTLYRTYFYEINPEGHERLFSSACGKSLVPWFHRLEAAALRLACTSVRSTKLEDKVEQGERVIPRFQFDPATYRAFCEVLRKYPSLQRSPKVVADEQTLVLIGFYYQTKNKWYYELPWHSVPEAILCTWVFHYYTPTGGALPFGLSKRKYEGWLASNLRVCYLCRCPLTTGHSCPRCTGLLTFS